MSRPLWTTLKSFWAVRWLKNITWEEAGLMENSVSPVCCILRAVLWRRCYLSIIPKLERHKSATNWRIFWMYSPRAVMRSPYIPRREVRMPWRRPRSAAKNMISWSAAAETERWMRWSPAWSAVASVRLLAISRPGAPMISEEASGCRRIWWELRKIL